MSVFGLRRRNLANFRRLEAPIEALAPDPLSLIEDVRRLRNFEQRRSAYHREVMRRG